MVQHNTFANLVRQEQALKEKQGAQSAGESDGKAVMGDEAELEKPEVNIVVKQLFEKACPVTYKLVSKTSEATYQVSNYDEAFQKEVKVRSVLVLCAVVWPSG